MNDDILVIRLAILVCIVKECNIKYVKWFYKKDCCELSIKQLVKKL